MQVRSRQHRGWAAAVIAAMAVAGGACVTAAAAGPAAGAARPAGPRTAVIVRGTPGAAAEIERFTTRLGGTVTRELPIVDGFAGSLPAAAVAALRARTDVLDVTPDASGHVMSINPMLGYDATSDTGSLPAVEQIVGTTAAYSAGVTGKGVDVALIDTGVAQVQGLTSGNVINGPDLSFDSGHADVRYRDTYGHGTHMASIIAGRDVAGTPASYLDNAKFHGIAPDARIVSLKVGASDGSADVSQVIAAIGWVAEHAHSNGLNIRVLNLSYGTDGKQDYHLDPLAYACEVAWRKGVLVVVAGGNDGTDKVDLANPAMDGTVLAVGASDPNGTLAVADDTVPAFADRGTSTRHVDVVAPGVHILGLRVPNGLIDQAYPSARVGTRFFRGSGTSQSTAVVSGVAALLFQHYPGLSPQQAKMIIGYGAQWMAKGTTTSAGAGIVNANTAIKMSDSALTRALASTTTATFGTGLGSLEPARGTSHVSLDGVALTGERDIFGKAWTPTPWAASSLLGTSWSADGSWNGSGWTASTWANATDWSGRTWAGTTWTGRTWAGVTWTGRTWAAGSWDGRTWADNAWSGRTWAGRTWAGATWS
jgi:serine protease AprX